LGEKYKRIYICFRSMTSCIISVVRACAAAVTSRKMRWSPQPRADDCGTPW